jgi:hypothetical protein
MEKKFKLFVAPYFHPDGGYGDYAGNFSSIEDAKSYVEETHNCCIDYFSHIVLDDKIIVRGENMNCIGWEWSATKQN